MCGESVKNAIGRDARATAASAGVRVGVWKVGVSSDAGPGRYRLAAHGAAWCDAHTRLDEGERQGLTLVHFSAQLEPCLTQGNTP